MGRPVTGGQLCKRKPGGGGRKPVNTEKMMLKSKNWGESHNRGGTEGSTRGWKD